MRESPSDCTVVLGAGLSGLTVALELARRGRRVVVLESDSEVGGLARTVAFGGYRFDVGGHRFHSSWPHVTAWVRDLLGGDLVHVDRRSRIHLNGRYADYPLRLPNGLLALGAPRAARVLASYLMARLWRRGRGPDVSFEDWVVHRFGRELFEVYFRPYTEKVWGMECSELSADWASQRIMLPSLAAAVRGSLFQLTTPPATLVSRFMYPPLGIGTIATRLAREATSTGMVTICLNSQVFRLEESVSAGGWRVLFREAGEERTVSGRQVVSTIPLSALVKMLPSSGTAPNHLGDTLTYRSLICVFLAVDGCRISADTWTYFPDRDLLLGRTHEPANWSRQMAPRGKTSLCVEVFCTAGDETWQRRDQDLVNSVMAELDTLGFVRRERVLDAWLLRVPHAYPVFRVGYGTALDQVRGHLARWPTLHLAGRTGSFRYLNMDAVIAQALDLVKRLVGAE